MNLKSKIRSIDEQFFNKKRKPNNKVVFHYTSPTALMSILTNNSKTIVSGKSPTMQLRFTDCEYLNDKSEYNNIHDCVKEVLEGLSGSFGDLFTYEEYQNSMGSNFETKILKYSIDEDNPGFTEEKHRYYVFCASNNNDLLNMWNYYNNDGNYQGYNLGLSVNSLIESISSSIDNQGIIAEVLYGNVKYDHKEKCDAIKTIIEDRYNLLYFNTAEGKIDKTSSEYANLKKITDYKICQDLELLRLFYKNDAFSAEREFRCVIVFPKKGNKKIPSGYHIKKGIFSPHIDIVISSEDVLKNITIGPIMDQDLATSGLYNFLETMGFITSKEDVIEILSSKIPIRY